MVEPERATEWTENIQACPPEVLDQVFSLLPYCLSPEPEEESFPHLGTLAACSLACRTLAAASRPHLFRQVKLQRVAKAKQLCSLMVKNTSLPKWIKELVIYKDRSDDNIPSWIGSPAGQTFLSQLHSLRELSLGNFWIYKHITEHDLSSAWKNILCLQSITSLRLNNCTLLSPEVAIELFTKAFPHLEEVTLFKADCDPPDEEQYPDENSLIRALLSGVHFMAVPLAVNLTPTQVASLRAMDLREFYGNKSELLHLIGSFRCENLTTLSLCSHGIFGDTSHNQSYGYAQDLLSHAPSLKHLTLNHYSIPKESGLDLAMNPNLECIVFNHFGQYEWISPLLATLPNPGRLSRIVISGRMRETQDETWHSLDQTFSDPHYECAPGERSFNIKHWDFAPTTTPGISEGKYQVFRFKEDFLCRTQHLGWFKIHWPSEFVGMAFTRDLRSICMLLLM